MKEINIGLMGCGTVGTGVAKILIEQKELICDRVGARINLKRVADIDTETDRGIAFDEGVFIKDAFQILEDDSIDIVLEMIGGQTIAKDLILKAFEKGKQVVTANKALLAHQGSMLFRKAAQMGIDLAFEASVGGCMPVIKTIRESLVGNRIQSMTGILNGTCNYILSKITNEGVEFESALAKAQANGFAEADPTLDLDGWDTAHKLAIMTALAYGVEINLNDIYVEGISGITPMDIEFARQFGYRIKLLAIAKNLEKGLDLRVHPTMIPKHNLLANVNGSVNALMISGDAIGDMMLFGHGAGMMPTASAVVSDLVDLARDMLAGSSHGRIPLLSYQANRVRSIPVIPIEDLSTYYYFRFSAMDQPGVLSKISGVLGHYGISLKFIHQKGRKANGSVPLVMLTHIAKEANVKKALKEIAASDVVDAKPILIRIEDNQNND